jgi:hypothetical protein
MRKIQAIFIAMISVLAITPNFASADTKPIEQFYDQGPAVKNVGGYTGILVEDAGRITGRQSRLIGMYYEQKNGSWVQKEAFVCRTYSDPNCTNADNIWYDAVLDVCKSDADSNCIVGVTAIKDGKEIPGKFAVNFPEKSDFTFKGDAALKIPDGGLPSIWTFDGLTHQGGDKFLVFAEYFHPGGYGGGGKPILYPHQFNSGIFAMSSDKNPLYPDIRVRAGKADSSGKAWYANTPAMGCFVIGEHTGNTGECGLAWPLPTNVRYRLEIRTSIQLTSFMHGRLLDPTIKISTDSAGRQIFSVEGGPVSVPVLNTWVKNSEMPKGLYDYLYAMNDWGGDFLYDDKLGKGRDSVQLLQAFDQYDANAFKEYLWWLEVAKDKSIGSKSMWIARTLSSQEIWSSGTSSCLSNNKELTGIVTTNANMYISSPPVFNKEAQSLDYKVSSPHFDENGKLNVGNYNLVLSSEAARCLYNFSKAPISATVSIVSADGTAQVATTTVNEKNGWLYLSANGFNYSAPTVRVKLTQEAEKPVATPSPSASAAPVAVAKKTTITCVKGKTSKKVTAVKPVCPAGFKKK